MKPVALITSTTEDHLKWLLNSLKISDYSLDILPGSIKGTNFLGTIANVIVKRKNKDGENAILDLIVKRAPCNENLRKYMSIALAYERETYIYSQVLPEYIKLQDEKCLKERFTSFPKFYSSTMEDLNEAIVMENMKARGFKSWNQFVPLDYNHVQLVMKNYGKLHALSFAIKDQKPDLFSKFSANTQEKVKVQERTTKNEFEYLQIQAEKALSVLDPEEEVYKRLKVFKESMVSKLHISLKSEEAGEYAVISHGDCWINNFLFKYEDTKEPMIPIEVCLLDWQFSRLGSPALDLAHFVFTCTDKALRDQHYENLISEYYNAFCSFLRQLGSDPEKLFPYDVLQKHLKKFSVYGLVVSVMILYVLSSDNDELPDITSFQDIEDVRQKFSYVSKNIDKYKTRIRGVLLDFIKYNYDF